ncbi:MAG: 2-phosphosulfolactate phosphatase, partial [Microbacterium aurantiacum]
GIRFAVEDELGAGAIIDALAAFGIDHTSPEAAAACAAFQGLRPAVRHLLTAAGSGQQLIADGARDDAIAAAMVDAAPAAPRLIDGTFSAAAISGE